MNAKSHVFPVDDLHKIHDGNFAFTPSSIQDQLSALSTPAAKRSEIYGDSPIPDDIAAQINNYSKPLDTRLSREQIYYPQIPSLDVVAQQINLSDGISPPPLATQLPRDQIYVGTPPPNISSQTQEQAKDKSFTKGVFMSAEKRKEFYQKNTSNTFINSNIGGTEFSNETLLDKIVKQNQPPPIKTEQTKVFDLNLKPVKSSLSFQGPRHNDTPNINDLQYLQSYDINVPYGSVSKDRTTLDDTFRDYQNIRKSEVFDVNKASNDIKNNLYNGGPISFVQGGKFALAEGAIAAPIRGFDIFSIAHWFRNVGSEISFLPKWTNEKPINGTTESKGAFKTNPETIQKSAMWLASNLLLTSLNSGDVQGYGPLNMVWNPLSLLTQASPVRPTGIFGINPSSVTVGGVFADYKFNSNLSVAMNTERLVLMRHGAYVPVNPVKRLQQLRSPIATPGFIGDINGPQLKTLDDELKLSTSPLALASITRTFKWNNGFHICSIHAYESLQCRTPV